MDILSEKAQLDWNRFVIENSGSFLQSWEWGEFQESLGRKIWRLKIGDELIALIIKYPLPLGKSYLYCPAGPVFKKATTSLPSSDEEGVGGGVDVNNQHPSSRPPRTRERCGQAILPSLALPKPSAKRRSEGRRCKDVFREFLAKIREIGKQENSIFLKVEPFWRKIHPTPPFLKEGVPPLGKGRLACPHCYAKHCRRGGIFIKSDGGQRIKETLVLDLSKSEEELLAGMKQKTRYNIRVAEKHDVRVRISDRPEKDFEEFWRLMRETAKRDRIKSHPKDYYFKQLSLINAVENGSPVGEPLSKYFGDGNNAVEIKLFLAGCQNKIIAANIVVFFGPAATYLHGASDYEHRHLMAPHLLQWEQIKEAKRRGCKVYDFWGIDEKRWPGVTKFKKGFGGYEVEYIGTYDYVFDRKWYFLYNLARRIKKC